MNIEKELEKTYSVKELSGILKLSTNSVYAAIKSGKLEAYKVGISYRVTPKQLEKYIKSYREK